MGEVAAHRSAAGVKHELRRRLLAHLLALGPVHARAERTGELVNILTEGVESLDAYFARYLPQLALAALVPLAVLGSVFPLDLVSGLILLFHTGHHSPPGRPRHYGRNPGFGKRQGSGTWPTRGTTGERRALPHHVGTAEPGLTFSKLNLKLSKLGIIWIFSFEP